MIANTVSFAVIDDEFPISIDPVNNVLSFTQAVDAEQKSATTKKISKSSLEESVVEKIRADSNLDVKADWRRNVSRFERTNISEKFEYHKCVSVRDGNWSLQQT